MARTCTGVVIGHDGQSFVVKHAYQIIKVHPVHIKKKNDPIYVKDDQALCLSPQHRKLWKLKKCIYGLVDGPRMWYMALKSTFF